MDLKVKRIYDAPDPDDGARILVDRIWPRGMSKERAALDTWMREIGPSDALRTWFGHEPSRWPEFIERYHRELDQNEARVAELEGRFETGRVTLLYSAKDRDHNQAVALAEYLRRRAQG